MRDVYTTGEVARVCKVANRTVSKWIDTGRIKGYRLPGSRDRRVTHGALLRFLRENGMPTDALEKTTPLAFALSPDPALVRRLHDHLTLRRYDFLSAPNAFEAGAVLTNRRPHALVIDFQVGRCAALEVARHLTTLFPRAPLAALLDEDAAPDPRIDEVAHEVYRRPFDPAVLEGFLTNVLVET